MTPDFGEVYRGRRVFITGNTGFKGSWLALWLKELGAEVRGYSIDVPTDPSHHALLRLDYPTVTADVTDAGRLEDELGRFRPEIVFHLAAQALVRDSYVRPVNTFATNVMGTVNLLEACRSLEGIRAVVNVTSDKCYRNDERGEPYGEAAALGGRDPYSASKACAEMVGFSYRSSFFHPTSYGRGHSPLIADARAGNVIGGGDWARDRLLPDLVRGADRGKEAEIRNPSSVRPWQHVLEPLSGYLLLGQRLLQGHTEASDDWNFGPAGEGSLTVREVVEIGSKHWDRVRFVIKEDKDQPHEAGQLRLDSSKARSKLGWRSLWTAEEALARTFQWYRTFYECGPEAAASASRLCLSEYIGQMGS
jgi:CDP-glucose 4,6-dehydratase